MILELDDQAEVISYEEYYPYGSTSYQAVRVDIEVSPKRYRYTGKERDAENGLYYYGARYYAPWLARWMSCDPVKMVDGLNLYIHSRNDPINRHDLDGKQSSATEKDNVIPQPSPDPQSEWSMPDTFEKAPQEREESLIAKSWLDATGMSDMIKKYTPKTPVPENVAEGNRENVKSLTPPPLLDSFEVKTQVIQMSTRHGYTPVEVNADPIPDPNWREPNIVYDLEGRIIGPKGVIQPEPEEPSSEQSIRPDSIWPEYEEKFQFALGALVVLIAIIALVWLSIALLVGFAAAAFGGAIIAGLGGMIWMMINKPWTTPAEDRANDEEARKAREQEQYRQLRQLQKMEETLNKWFGAK